MAPGSAFRHGNARSRWRRAGEQGRAAGHGQRGASSTVRWARMSRGPSVSGGVREGEG
jgi:hypothetical protein